MQVLLAHANVHLHISYEYTQIEALNCVGSQTRVVTFTTVMLHRFDGDVLRNTAGLAEHKSEEMNKL